MNDWAETAARWGIDPGFHDVFGNWHQASPEALQSLVEAVSAGRPEPRQARPPGADSAALQAFQGAAERMWVIAVQLYAVRSRRNWGHGDFTDLKALLRLCAAAGADGIGLNPLHALFPAKAEQASPYSPNSRIFLNALYLDVESIPEFPGVAALGLGDEIAALREAGMVAYARVAVAKLKGLRAAHDRFRKSGAAARRADFEAYRAEHGERLLRFAIFEVLSIQYGTSCWWEWPAEWRAPTPQTVAVFADSNPVEIEFHQFVQWNADRQLGACRDLAKELGLSLGLYVDLAVGVDPAGADAWSDQREVLAGVSVGAPPDQLNRAGQDWGLTTYNPQALIESDFAPLRKMLEAAMRFAGAVRIDHVLGLMRMYIIPKGAGAVNGSYVHYPFDQLLHVVAEESVQHQCIVVGEDLGTVPEGFRAKLQGKGLWSYLVVMFERGHDGRFRRPEDYSALALATFNTHDLPTYAGWMSGEDLTLKRSIGLDPGETGDEREQSRQALRAALSPYGRAEDFSSVAAFLARTPSRLVSVALEDILEVREQVNIPGTVDQHPNWRLRLPALVEDLEKNESLRAVAAAFSTAGRGHAKKD